MQHLGDVGPLPRKTHGIFAEVSAAGDVAVDRAAQFKARRDAAWAHVDMLHKPARDLFVAHAPRAKRVDHHAHRVGEADGIGKLDLAAVGQLRGHNVLGEIARHVSARAVDLARVLARERPAAVARHAAIGVGDDLAAGKAAVARGPANDKSSRRVDEILCVLVEQFRRQHRENDLF